MPRYLRNTVILAKLETTYGTDAAPVGATDALLVSNVQPRPLVANNVDRDLVRGYLGGSEQLVGTAYKELSFDIELAGAGTPTTPPQWGKLLQACGFAQAIGAASVDYTPTSTFGASSSLTIHYHMDGERHVLLGARGTFTLALNVGERPVLRMRFIGKNGGISAVANPSPTLTPWGTPLVVTDTNTADIALGAVTYTGATGVVAGGTSYLSRGVEIDVGNEVNFTPILGDERVTISQRAVQGSAQFDLTAAQAVTFMGDVLANTTVGFGITHGTTAGNIIVVHAPKAQRIDPSVEDQNGEAFHGYSMRFVPNTGNDEIRFVSR